MKQVAQAIDDALVCDCHDPLLNGLRVVDVQAIEGTHMLQVVCAVPADTPINQIDEVYMRLQLVKGMLRAAVASAVNRKRTPDFRLLVIPENHL